MVYKIFAGNPIKGMLINTTLKGIGIKNARWIHCGDTKKEKLNERVKFIEKLKQMNFS